MTCKSPLLAEGCAMVRMTFREALRSALTAELTRDESVVLRLLLGGTVER